MPGFGSVHQFDEERASEYAPNPAFTKTAVLVDVADPEAITILRTSFGQQAMRGPFYIVANGPSSYGAAKAEFERVHEPVGASEWRKIGDVRAYRSMLRCEVETRIDDQLETTVMAEIGDWIVRQQTGEVMVIGPESFAQRYVDLKQDRATESS